jgi:hypothetical protein
MTTHVMIDLETWGTLPGSALRSIGAVTFSPYGDAHEEKHFYANIEVGSCEAAGLKFEPDTEAWWQRQSADSQRRLADNRRALNDVILDFNEWWHSAAGTYVWSNGANFDEVLWRAAAASIHHSVPWKYWNVRDTRTCWDLAGLNPKSIPFEGVQHDAIADARHQARCVTRAYSMLRIQPGSDAT